MLPDQKRSGRHLEGSLTWLSTGETERGTCTITRCPNTQKTRLITVVMMLIGNHSCLWIQLKPSSSLVLWEGMEILRPPVCAHIRLYQRARSEENHLPKARQVSVAD